MRPNRAGGPLGAPGRCCVTTWCSARAAVFAFGCGQPQVTDRVHRREPERHAKTERQHQRHRLSPLPRRRGWLAAARSLGVLGMTAAASDRRDRLRAMLADLKMPGALEAVDGVLAKVDSGAATAGEAMVSVP